MRKVVLGYIFSEKGLGKDEEIFMNACRKKKISIEMFNLLEKINEEIIEEKAKRCDLIFNNSAEEFATEMIKTLETLGKKVVDSSSIYYNTEDKWIFYLKCKEHNIPTPETILLSENVNMAKKELKDFGKWPAVLKRVWGTQGNYVEKAENLNEAEKIIKDFWERGNEKLPIIAQEFVKSPSYRVTTIGNEIVQTALKENKGWKSTGVYEKKFKKFEIDPELEKIMKKLTKTLNIKICGVDLVKKEDKWLVLEANATPAFDFFEDEREVLIEKVIDYLTKEIKTNK